MVFVQPKIRRRKWDTVIFKIETDQLISARRPDLVIVNEKQKKSVLADHWLKIKEIQKRAKNLDVARELKKQWNMKLTVISVVVGTLGTILKGLVEGMEDLKMGEQVDTIHTAAL